VLELVLEPARELVLGPEQGLEPALGLEPARELVLARVLGRGRVQVRHSQQQLTHQPMPLI